MIDIHKKKLFSSYTYIHINKQTYIIRLILDTDFYIPLLDGDDV